jgi:hypothetical protein
MSIINNWIKDENTPLSDPNAEAKRLLTEYKKEAKRKGHGYTEWKPKDLDTGKIILESSAAVQIAVLTHLLQKAENDYYYSGLETNLLQRNLPYDAEQLLGILHSRWNSYSYGFASRLRHVRRFVDGGGVLSPELRAELEKIRASVDKEGTAESAKVAVAVREILGEEEVGVLPDDSGEAWATCAIADVNATQPGAASAWGNGSSPTPSPAMAANRRKSGKKLRREL